MLENFLQIRDLPTLFDFGEVGELSTYSVIYTCSIYLEGNILRTFRVVRSEVPVVSLSYTRLEPRRGMWVTAKLP